MSLLTYLKARLRWFASGSQADQDSYKLARVAERGKSKSRDTYCRAHFERDYNTAGDLTGWLWTGLIERISQDRRS